MADAPLERMRQLARLYDSDDCRRAVNSTWHRFQWHEMAMTWTPQAQETAVLTASGTQWMYVRAQKAGSFMLLQLLLRASQQKNINGPLLQLCDPGPCGGERGGETPRFTWTAVRDPWPRALSAYAEVVHRGQLNFPGVEPPAPAFANVTAISCDTELSATRRYSLFLELLRSGRLVYREIFHSWPVALLIDTLSPTDARRFDAIARIESIERDLPALLNLTGIEVTAALGFEGSRLREHQHSNAAEPCIARVSRVNPSVLRPFCELYHVDYACFNYTAPPACRTLVPHLAWYKVGTE